MRVIETVRTCQCPRCGKPATRCRCDLKKSIRQRTKCVFSYILPKVAEIEKLSSTEAPSPQSFQLILQNPIPETTTDADMILAEYDITCPRCIKKLKRCQESQEEDPIDNTVCQHCMLKAQVCKLKAEKRKLRSRSQHIRRTSRDDKFEIIYICKKYHSALTDSKPSCDEQDGIIKIPPKETEVKVPVKLKYSPNELNILCAKSMPADITKTQDMFQHETSFLTYKEDNAHKPTDVEKNIATNKYNAEEKVSKALAFPPECTFIKIQPDLSRSQVTYLCSPNQDMQKAKEESETTDDHLTASAPQVIMSYRFPTNPKKDTLRKPIISSELIRRTREKLLDKKQDEKEKEGTPVKKIETEKRKKEKELDVKKEELRDSLKEKEKNKNEGKPQKEKSVQVIKSQKRNIDEEAERKKNKDKDEEAEIKKRKDEEAERKKKKDKDEEAERKKKRDKDEEAERKKKKDKDEEAERKKKKDKDEEAERKKNKEEELLKKQKAEEEKLNKEQQKLLNKKEETEAAKKEKASLQVAKRENEGNEEGKKKLVDDEKRTREKRQYQTDSEQIIHKLIKEHKVKRAEERTLQDQHNIMADRQKLTEMAKKTHEDEAGKARQIEEEINKRIQANMYTPLKPEDEDKVLSKRKSKMTEIIIGENLFESNLPLPPDPMLQDQQDPVTPLLFKKKTVLSDPLDAFIKNKSKHDKEKQKESKSSDIKANTKNKKNSAPPEQKDSTDGVFRYALSDRSFIDKGWTVLPVEEVVRKMNVYRMRPAQPEFDWFERNKSKRYLEFDTGEKLAVFDDNGRCRWYYKNGRLALDYYNSEELHSQHRFVVYSNGEPDERGRSRPYTVLATFSHLGTGVVFDHGGKIRLKYNQTEGVLLDREIGPVTTWKWHSLNDPPVLRQVMINSKLSHKDQRILRLGEKDDHHSRKKDEMMIAIENENSIREMRQKQSLDFKPFQIKTKVLKINENFSLKVLDQATIYLIFREGSANIKLNIGMLLDHQEIVDTDTAALGVVSTCVERFPAATESIAALQRSVEYAKHFERNRTERERMLRPAPPGDSTERLAAGLSRPLKVPLRTLSKTQTASKINVEHCKCTRRPYCNLYYNSRLP